MHVTRSIPPGSLGRWPVLVLAAGVLAGCLADYQDQYKLRPGGRFRPAYPETTLQECANTRDDDGDGLVDCADPGCGVYEMCFDSSATKAENTLARCQDVIDNDANGAADCADVACKAFQVCAPQPPGPDISENTAERCQDGRDNDGNALVDCADKAGCGAFKFCQPPVENTPELCLDEKDNDGDGFVDCKDSDCKAFSVCNPTENTLALCKDGKDNDADALIDCRDPDCKDLYVCSYPTQDTVLILGYKTKGKVSPALNAVQPPRNLTWYYNGGDAIGADALGLKGIVPGHNEETSACGQEPLCRKIIFSDAWGIAFTIFFRNDGAQDTVDLSPWIASSLRFSIQSQVANLRLKIESKHAADAVEIPLADIGFDPAKPGWQDLSVPLIQWLTMQKLSANRLPFSIWKPAGPGGEVRVENIRLE